MQNFPPVNVVREALRKSGALPLDIYTETGLTPAWLQAVGSGRTGDPGYAKMVLLIGYLVKHHLDVYHSCFTVEA